MNRILNTQLLHLILDKGLILEGITPLFKNLYNHSLYNHQMSLQL